MPDLTTPDSLPFPKPGEGVANLEDWFEDLAQGVQAALSKREVFTYIWEDDAARTAQTGMVQSSQGYQLDTKTEYLFDGGTWRISTPYAEFASAAVNSSSAAYGPFGALTLDESKSTNTSFAVVSGQNIITLADPGIYAISAYSVAASAFAASDISFAMMGTAADATTVFASQASRGPFAGDNVSMLAMPFHRTTAPNQILNFWYRTSVSKSIYSRVRIGRLA